MPGSRRVRLLAKPVVTDRLLGYCANGSTADYTATPRPAAGARAPRPAPDPATQRPARGQRPGQDPAGRRPAGRSDLPPILEPLGEHLIDASFGTEALKRLMDDDFALILLDVNMPGMDGFETASLIHQHRVSRRRRSFSSRGQRLGHGPAAGLQAWRGRLRDGAGDPRDPAQQGRSAGRAHRKRRELQALNTSLAADNQALQIEKARELEALNESLRIANDALAARNAGLQTRSASAPRSNSCCAMPTSARTNFSPPSHTNCATRWRRCEMRWRSGAWRWAGATMRCRNDGAAARPPGAAHR